MAGKSETFRRSTKKNKNDFDFVLQKPLAVVSITIMNAHARERSDPAHCCMERAEHGGTAACSGLLLVISGYYSRWNRWNRKSYKKMIGIYVDDEV